METKRKQYYIIDFDSTFISVESLDVLIETSLQNHPEKKSRLAAFSSITQQGMDGLLPFADSLQQRLQLLTATKADVNATVQKLKGLVSKSFARNQSAILALAPNVYIISGGFKEMIAPVVTAYGISEDHILANEFVYNEDSQIVGIQSNNLLSQNDGKSKALAALNLKGDIHAVGDGYTDMMLKQSGLANQFYLYTENVTRPTLTAAADYVVHSLDEFLYINNLARSQSFPKSRIKVLLLENIHPNAMSILQLEGFQIEILKEALDENTLCDKISDVHILGIRSKTEVTARVLAHAKKLMCIGTFCIGTNQVDLASCAQKGIPVFNAPFSNTRSVVELTIGNIIMLMRNAFTKSSQLHAGTWDKSSKNCFEIRGKALGIVGYGNIGSQLSVLAEALGMRVYFYDLADKQALGNAKRCSTLQELLAQCEVLSLHVDGRDSNTHLIGAEQIKHMKPNAVLLNLSRGHIVDLSALSSALQRGHLAGAALDVYPYEPSDNAEKFELLLQNLPNVILTPHIGGSTEEAQANIGDFVPYKVINYLSKGDTYGAVNLPEVQLPEFTEAHRLLHIHTNTPGILAQINAVFAKYNVNIHAQFLKTNTHLGYVITDVADGYNKEIISEINAIEGTIRFRSIYN
jgi:D-3-phosphoglycerate dehydrogenase / 2-oxoglutarate reductase